MKTRGRDSAIAQETNVSHLPQWPEAPEKLTDFQKAVWQEIVKARPVDWFPCDTHGLLVEYCRHAESAERIAEKVDSWDEDDVKDLDKLLHMAERESRILASLATKLRITNQSRYDYKAAGAQKNNKPSWA